MLDPLWYTIAKGVALGNIVTLAWLLLVYALAGGLYRRRKW